MTATACPGRAISGGTSLDQREGRGRAMLVAGKQSPTDDGLRTTLHQRSQLVGALDIGPRERQDSFWLFQPSE